ncbi:MAG: hypothetical protein PHE27_05775 [Alphaproteobacteria bacterium]|nr:hypothetical protein [Alphaproteobacteria bacterium]
MRKKIFLFVLFASLLTTLLSIYFGALVPCSLLLADVRYSGDLTEDIPDDLILAAMRVKYGKLTPLRCTRVLYERKRDALLDKF